MPKVFTEGKRVAEGVLSEANKTRSRDTITIASGAGIIAPMTVLGRVTVTGKYIPSAVGASDGSQVAVAINLRGGDATSADLVVEALTRDCEVVADSLTYHSSVDTAPEILAVRAQLAAVGIIVR